MTQNNSNQPNTADQLLSQKLESDTSTQKQKEDAFLQRISLNNIAQEANAVYPEQISPELVAQMPQIQEQMQNDLQERFSANMQVFKEQFPEIHKLFVDFKPSQSLEFTCSTNGIANLFFPQTNQFFYNALNPVSVCEHQTEVILKHMPLFTVTYTDAEDPYGQIHFRYHSQIIKTYQDAITPEQISKSGLVQESCPTVILLGCGLGYCLDSLYSRVDIGNLILVEPNLDLFYASLYTFGWFNLLNYLKQNNRHIEFILGQNSEQALNSIQNYSVVHGYIASCDSLVFLHYQTPDMVNLYNTIIQEYCFRKVLMGFFDDHLFEVSHSIQCLKEHVPFFKQSINLPKELRESPLCIVGNGPSLSNDLDFLRKNQDNVVILACGSVIETLYAEGIKPHFYACLERVDTPLLALDIIPDKSYFDDIILLATNVVYPKILKLFKHKVLFMKGNESFFFSLLAGYANKIKDLKLIFNINPLVGNFGVTIGSVLQFKKIYFLGLDNGTTEQDLSLHSNKSVLYKKTVKHNKEIRESLSRVYEGNFGKKVYTRPIYETSTQNINKTISFGIREHGIEYFNCSDGIKYDHATPVHAQTLDFTQQAKVDRQQIIDFVTKQMSFNLDLHEKDFNTLCYYEIFDQTCDEIIGRFKQIQDSQTITNRLECALQLQQIIEYVYSFKMDRHFIRCMLNGSLETFLAECYKTLYSINDFAQAKQILDKQITLFIYFLEDAKQLHHLVPNYIAVEHIKLLNNKVGYDHEGSLAPTFEADNFKITSEDIANYPVQKFVKRYE